MLLLVVNVDCQNNLEWSVTVTGTIQWLASAVYSYFTSFLTSSYCCKFSILPTLGEMLLQLFNCFWCQKRPVMSPHGFEKSVIKYYTRWYAHRWMHRVAIASVSYAVFVDYMQAACHWLVLHCNIQLDLLLILQLMVCQSLFHLWLQACVTCQMWHMPWQQMSEHLCHQLLFLCHHYLWTCRHRRQCHRLCLVLMVDLRHHLLKDLYHLMAS